MQFFSMYSKQISHSRKLLIGNFDSILFSCAKFKFSMVKMNSCTKLTSIFIRFVMKIFKFDILDLFRAQRG